DDDFFVNLFHWTNEPLDFANDLVRGGFEGLHDALRLVLDMDGLKGRCLLLDLGRGIEMRFAKGLFRRVGRAFGNWRRVGRQTGGDIFGALDLPYVASGV